MIGIGSELLELNRSVTVHEIDAVCSNCEDRRFRSLHINGDTVSSGGYYCRGCGRAESFLFSGFRSEQQSTHIDLTKVWQRFHGRLKHYTVRAAKDPDVMIETRCIEVLHEASSICGRKDVADFNLHDLKCVADYIYKVCERAGMKGWTANDVLTIKGVADDLSAMRPLIYQAEFVAAVMSPATVLAKIFGIAAIGTGMVLPARAKRAGTVYAFGYLAFLLMAPKSPAEAPGTKLAA